MKDIHEFLDKYHTTCEALCASVQTAVEHNRRNDAKALWAVFRDNLERHFLMEERALYPDLQRDAGITAKLVYTLRMEHQEMREILKQMDAAINDSDNDLYLSLSDVFYGLMQQHNIHEEKVIHPRLDRLNSQTDTIRKMVTSV